jgi:hypothetical protein
MNEFEKLLASVEPAESKADPMQIMFLAGQQSAPSTQSSGAGHWKLATGFLTAACVALIACLAFYPADRNDNNLASQPEKPTPANEDSGSQITKQNAPLELVSDVQPNRFPIREASLDDPESWNSVGPRLQQLRSVTRGNLQTGQRGEVDSLSPFAYQRASSPNAF